MRHLRFSLLIFITLPLLSFSQNQSINNIESDILLTRSASETLTIQGLLKNNTTHKLSLSYELVVDKNNDSSENKSVNKQSGSVTVSGQRSITTSKTRLNFSQKDQLTVVLSVFLNDSMLLTQTKSLSGEGFVQMALSTNEQQQIFSDGVELGGIVIDETKTKLGRDYFDYFISEYNLKKEAIPVLKNSSYNIVINEAPLFARTTRITVKLGDELIFQANTTPSQEYLQNMAEYTLMRIGSELEKKEQLGIKKQLN